MSLIDSISYVVTRYKKTNTVLVSHIEERENITVQCPSDSEAEWTIEYPFLICYDGVSLYMYNIERNSFEEFVRPIEEK